MICSRIKLTLCCRRVVGRLSGEPSGMEHDGMVAPANLENSNWPSRCQFAEDFHVWLGRSSGTAASRSLKEFFRPGELDFI